MTRIDTARLIELAGKATPGPWELDREATNYFAVRGEGGQVVRTVISPNSMRRSEGLATAEFIAAADPYTITALARQRDELLEALKEIAKGEGEYSRDRLTHAANTIDSMQTAARAAIARCEAE